MAEPQQITVLENKNDKAACTELSKDELDAQREAVAKMENYIKDFNKPSPAAEAIPH